MDRGAFVPRVRGLNGADISVSWKPERAHLPPDTGCIHLLSGTQPCRVGNKKAGLEMCESALMGGTCPSRDCRGQAGW